MQSRMAMSAPVLRPAGRSKASALQDCMFPRLSQVHTRIVSVPVLLWMGQSLSNITTGRTQVLILFRLYPFLLVITPAVLSEPEDQEKWKLTLGIFTCRDENRAPRANNQSLPLLSTMEKFGWTVYSGTSSKKNLCPRGGSSLSTALMVCMSCQETQEHVVRKLKSPFHALILKYLKWLQKNQINGILLLLCGVHTGGWFTDKAQLTRPVRECFSLLAIYCPSTVLFKLCCRGLLEVYKELLNKRISKFLPMSKWYS